MSRKRTKHAVPEKSGRSDAVPDATAGAHFLSFSNSRQTVLLAIGLIVLTTALAYSNSFDNAFVFDDEDSIPKNSTIWRLWPIWDVLSPPANGETVTARPLLNLSLALNFAASGTEVWSYHVTNLLIHLCGSLLLFGIVRRTFLLPSMRERWGETATALALVIALLWAVHPLQTESVTYIVQRAESLMGLWYLLTLYCVIRGAEPGGKAGWYGAAVLACLAGMASKEVIASAPIIVLFYDRAFLAGSFREAWRRRYGLYLALAATWLLLAWLVYSAGNRAGSVGVGKDAGIITTSISGGTVNHWWTYFCTQLVGIVHYLRLSVCPYPLVFDYGAYMATNVWAIAICGALVAFLGLATVAALWRWPKAGVLGMWFFAILAPTSSVLPVCVTQTIAEHRMYLPLAAVLIALVMGGFLAAQQLVASGRLSAPGARTGSFLLAAAVTAVFACLTFDRNRDYISEGTLWQDAVDKAPYNARAHNNLGRFLADQNQIDQAIEHCRKSLEIAPNYVLAHNNLGVALVARGQVDEAMVHYQRVLELKPDYAEAYSNFGLAYAKRGELDQAMAYFHKALEVNPNCELAHYNLGTALAWRGQIDEAIAEYRKALAIKPNYKEASHNMSVLLQRQSRASHR